MNYYTYNESTKQLTPVKRFLVQDGKTMILGNPADFAKYLEAYPQGVSTPPPKCGEGFHAVPDGYELVEELGVGSEGVDSPTPSLTHSITKKWVRKWRVEPIVYTEADYDNLMEDYLRQVRSERGYTTREPDDYFGSSNPRWAQDAKDWVAFRDAVMTYALDVINTYTKTGNAPTLAEFKAGFPKMVWTYQEEV